MWGGFLGKRRHCLPLIPWVKETPLCPGSLRVQGTDSAKWGAGWTWKPGADFAPGRAQWEGYGDSSGAGARGLLTFPGKASKLHTRSSWLLGSD